MRSGHHSWRKARTAIGQRFFLGAIVAASFTLVAFEWRAPGTGPKVVSDPIDEEDWLEPMIVVTFEKPQREKPVTKKRGPAIDPVVAVPILADPSPEPAPDPGIGGPGPDPAPDPAPGPIATTPSFVPGKAVKPYFEQCLTEDPAHVDPCTEERILAHLQRKFRMPGSVRGSVRTTITFRVEEDGNIGRIVCAPKVDPEVQREVERVLRAMPTFVPGSQGGVAVPVHYQIPLSLRVTG